MKQQGNVMRKTSVHWTAKELNLLFNMVEQSTPISEMAERLGRNEKAVSNKMYRIRQQMAHKSIRKPKATLENVMNEQEWMPFWKRLFK
jgi:ribosomal protein L22